MIVAQVALLRPDPRVGISERSISDKKSLFQIPPCAKRIFMQGLLKIFIVCLLTTVPVHAQDPKPVQPAQVPAPAVKPEPKQPELLPQIRLTPRPKTLTPFDLDKEEKCLPAESVLGKRFELERLTEAGFERISIEHVCINKDLSNDPLERQFFLDKPLFPKGQEEPEDGHTTPGWKDRFDFFERPLGVERGIDRWNFRAQREGDSEIYREHVEREEKLIVGAFSGGQKSLTFRSSRDAEFFKETLEGGVTHKSWFECVDGTCDIYDFGSGKTTHVPLVHDLRFGEEWDRRAQGDQGRRVSGWEFQSSLDGLRLFFYVRW